MPSAIPKATSRTAHNDGQMRRAKGAAGRAKRIRAQRVQTRSAATRREDKARGTEAKKPKASAKDTFARAARPAKASEWVSKVGTTGGASDRPRWPSAAREIKLAKTAGETFVGLGR